MKASVEAETVAGAEEAEAEAGEEKEKERTRNRGDAHEISLNDVFLCTISPPALTPDVIVDDMVDVIVAGKTLTCNEIK